MAERWSPKRREQALALQKEGKSIPEIVAEVELPDEMVTEFLSSETQKAAKAKKKVTARKSAPRKKVVKKPAKRVTAKKKAAKKAAKKGASKPKTEKRLSKKEKLKQLVANINAKFDTRVVRLAGEATTDYLLRRPTGILSLDIGLGGGWPASSLVQLTGPDGAGKDMLIDLTLAEQQRIHGNNFSAFIYSTEFLFDKVFANLHGFRVPLTAEELDRMDRARDRMGAPPLSEEEREELQTSIGDIVLLDGVLADEGLDEVITAVRSNMFQVVVINSLGVLQTVAKEEKESLAEHAIQSNEAQLLSRFMPKLFMALNRDDEDEKRNQTLVLATSQVRSKRDQPRRPSKFAVPEKDKWQGGTGAWAVKHGKSIELEIFKGSEHKDEGVKPPLLVGKEVNWHVAKGKLGTHEGKKGSFDLYYESGVDVLSDLINTAAHYGVVEKAGSWFSYKTSDGEEIRGQGQRNLRVKLAQNPELIEEIRNACFREANIHCLYK